MAAAKDTAEPISLKRERTCQSCKRAFWAWEETSRTQCYMCHAPSPEQVTLLMQRLWSHPGNPAAPPAMEPMSPH